MSFTGHDLIDLIGLFEIIHVRTCLLVINNKNSKSPMHRSFSQPLASEGGCQVAGAESATRSAKRSGQGCADLSASGGASTATGHHAGRGG